MTDTPRVLSMRDFAKLAGTNLSRIQQLAASGTIPKDAAGHIPMPAGMHAYMRWQEPTRAAPTPPNPDAEPTPVSPDDIGYWELEKMKWQARIAEQKYLQEHGELVPLAEVVADAQAACSAIRARFTALPSRVAVQLEALVASASPARAAQVEALVADEVESILSALHATRFGAARP